MHSLVCECIEEYRQCCHKGFTLTCCHLGYFTLMKHYATEELHIVMHHIPSNLITACHPCIMIDSLRTIYLHKIESWVCSELLIHFCGRNGDGLILCETTGSRLHNSENLGQYFCQSGFVLVFYLFF